MVPLADELGLWVDLGRAELAHEQIDRGVRVGPELGAAPQPSRVSIRGLPQVAPLDCLDRW